MNNGVYAMMALMQAEPGKTLSELLAGLGPQDFALDLVSECVVNGLTLDSRQVRAGERGATSHPQRRRGGIGGGRRVCEQGD